MKSIKNVSDFGLSKDYWIRKQEAKARCTGDILRLYLRAVNTSGERRKIRKRSSKPRKDCVKLRYRLREREFLFRHNEKTIERQVFTMTYIPSAQNISFLGSPEFQRRIAEAAAVGAGAIVESGGAGAVIAAVSAAAPIVIAGGICVGVGALIHRASVRRRSRGKQDIP